tara:strand:- start:11259 stop:11954 length:696 start_codon:yes stop_codon:yes gene_type:complete
MHLKEALARLDCNNDEHWTADGLPRMDAIVELLGGDTSVTRKAVTDAVPGLTRAIAKAHEVTGDEPITAAAEPEPEIDVEALRLDPDELDLDLDVLDLPMRTVLGNPELTADAIEAINAKVNSTLAARKAIEEELAQLYAKSEFLTRRKNVQDREARRTGAKKTNVQEYLAAQRTARAERAARALSFIQGGTTAKDVADQLRGASKLDAAMNQRKAAPGSTRPARRLPTPS